MMATYHVCDICGDDMPKDVTRQCFVQVGAKNTYREVNPNYDGLPYVNVECCPNCARKVATAIEALQAKPMPESGA